jgi:hypothetical protein
MTSAAVRWERARAAELAPPWIARSSATEEPISAIEHACVKPKRLRFG